MDIRLVSGRSRQDVVKTPIPVRIHRACHDECDPADAQTFAQSNLLNCGETPEGAAAMAVQLDQARTAGGEGVLRDQDSDDFVSTWCMICALGIQAEHRVAIVSLPL